MYLKMNERKLIKKARILRAQKCNPEKVIDSWHLYYLNKLSLLYFEMQTQYKPEFINMFLFSYSAPTEQNMRDWLIRYRRSEDIY